MKTVKISLGSCVYPLFIDQGLFPRLQEFCDLYRFPTTKIIFTELPENDQILQQIKNIEDFRVIQLSFQDARTGKEILERIYDAFPWEKQEKGITVVAIGTDWLIQAVGFAIGLLTQSVHLICIPISFWDMLETGINDQALLNWNENQFALSVRYCPALVLLDAWLLQQEEKNSFFLGVADILRHIVMGYPDLFQIMKEHILNMDSEKVPENIQIMEEVITARHSLLQNKEGGKWIHGFGIRLFREYRFGEEISASPRMLSLLILTELAWCWRLGSELGMSRRNDTESFFYLMGAICKKYRVTHEEWNWANSRLGERFNQDFLSDIYLPEKIGTLKQVGTINPDTAKKCLAEYEAL